MPVSGAGDDIVDLLVVGGGINGAGIARDAAGRGLKVLLVEQADLASATSSASTKLIHVELNGQTWVSQSHGIHPFKVGSRAKLYVDMDHAFFFDIDGRLVVGGG